MLAWPPGFGGGLGRPGNLGGGLGSGRLSEELIKKENLENISKIHLLLSKLLKRPSNFKTPFFILRNGGEFFMLGDTLDKNEQKDNDDNENINISWAVLWLLR